MSGVPPVPSQMCQLVLATPLMSGYFPVASSSPNHILMSPGLHGVGTSTHALSLPDASAFGTAPAAGVSVKEGPFTHVSVSPSATNALPSSPASISGMPPSAVRAALRDLAAQCNAE